MNADLRAFLAKEFCLDKFQEDDLRRSFFADGGEQQICY